MKKAQISNVPQVVKLATVFDEWKWDQFVKDAGLGSASLDEYYLGKIVGNVTVPDCKKLFTNLFSDAVSTGAVALPGSYRHTDFTYGTVKRPGHYSRVVDISRIALKGKPPVRGYLSIYDCSIEMFSCTLSSWTAKELARRSAKDASIALSYVFPVVFEYTNGARMWYLNGVHHREDGPAIEHPNGGKDWMLHGKWHRSATPAVTGPNGPDEWWADGKRHRGDGPAIEHFNGEGEWWVNGVRRREPQQKV
jgi:hypothetical protein